MESSLVESSSVENVENIEAPDQEATEEGEHLHLEELSSLEPLPLPAQVASLLFVSLRPLSLEQLATLTHADPETIEEVISTLSAELSEERFGFGIEDVGGSYQLRTSPRAARVVQRLIPPKSRRLSRAAAETLAVVAYKQPVQRAEIETIRGVDALPTLRTLLDARLIRIVGREASPGQPALYGTTSVFLEKFGLRDLSELPTLRELVELSQEPGETGPEESEPVITESGQTPSDEHGASSGEAEESGEVDTSELFDSGSQDDDHFDDSTEESSPS